MITMMRTILASTALLLLAGGGTLVTGCGGDAAKKPAADPAVVAEAKQVWESRCVTCHGPQGMGNGTNAKSCLLYTSPSPRDRTRSRMPSSA